MLHPDAPPMEEWWTLPQAASHLNISRQAVHQMVKSRKFYSIRRLGEQERPIYVVSSEEVRSMADKREARHRELLEDPA